MKKCLDTILWLLVGTAIGMLVIITLGLLIAAPIVGIINGDTVHDHRMYAVLSGEKAGDEDDQKAADIIKELYADKQQFFISNLESAKELEDLDSYYLDFAIDHFSNIHHAIDRVFTPDELVTIPIPPQKLWDFVFNPWLMGSIALLGFLAAFFATIWRQRKSKKE